jgi:hypothetical protein
MTQARCGDMACTRNLAQPCSSSLTPAQRASPTPPGSSAEAAPHAHTARTRTQITPPVSSDAMALQAAGRKLAARAGQAPASLAREGGCPGGTSKT